MEKGWPHVPVFWTDPLPIIGTIFVHFLPFFCMGKGWSWRQKEASAGDPVAGLETTGIWDLGLRVALVCSQLLLVGTKASPSLLPAEPEGNTPQIHTNKLPCNREQNSHNFIHFSGQLKPLNEGVDSYNVNQKFFPSPVICVGLMHLFTSIILYKVTNNSSVCSQPSTAMAMDPVLLGWQ